MGPPTVKAPAQQPEKALHPRPQAGLHGHPLGEKEEVGRQEHQKAPEDGRQHPQIHAADEVDDRQTAHRIEGNGGQALLEIDMLAQLPGHDGGLEQADGGHHAGGHGHVIKILGRHHHDHRRAEARQGLDDAAQEGREGHYRPGHTLFSLLFRSSPGSIARREKKRKRSSDLFLFYLSSFSCPDTLP